MQTRTWLASGALIDPRSGGDQAVLDCRGGAGGTRQHCQREHDEHHHAQEHHCPAHHRPPIWAGHQPRDIAVAAAVTALHCSFALAAPTVCSPASPRLGSRVAARSRRRLAARARRCGSRRAHALHCRAAYRALQALRRAVCSRSVPGTPFSSTGPISVNVTGPPSAASTTSWLTSTSPGLAYSAILAARFTVRPK